MNAIFRLFAPVLGAMGVLAWSGSVVAQPDIWLITESSQLAQGTQVPTRVIALDAPARIQAELSEGLPADPQQAAAIMQQRFTQGGTVLQQRMQVAYQGVADAWSMGITTIPAVVVDRRFVVYGTTNIDQAIARIAQYRQETGK
jgi:integrating conjugative element protein (TIGR03757 family)